MQELYVRVRRKLTNEMIDIIDGHLKENKIKSSSGRKKQQAKAIDIHESLISARRFLFLSFFFNSFFITIILIYSR